MYVSVSLPKQKHQQVIFHCRHSDVRFRNSTEKSMSVIYTNKEIKHESDFFILEVWDSFSHASDTSNDVAMGDHDTLGDACGAARVHDDGDIC